MSRLIVLTRPSLVRGFQLAGVDAYSAEDIETAQEFISGWLESGEVGLLAIDDGFFANMDPTLMRKLEASQNLPYLPIPGIKPLGIEASQRHRIAALIRRAIGFHITFKGDIEDSAA
jgi:vacuolar-type H+-ATPase subunit F/Vma7